MTNFQMKRIAREKFMQYTGIPCNVKDITLLEADTDGKYIFFSIGKLSFAWYDRFYTGFYAYPNQDGKDGMEVHMEYK